MSTVRADNVAPSAGGTSRNLPRGVAAAWFNLNGTGTIAGRDSQNISSYTDNGTGLYQGSFTNAMANANYATVTGISSTEANAALPPMVNTTSGWATTAPVVGSVRLCTAIQSTTITDIQYINADVRGSLA
jgi:hypothetical protein